MSGLAVQPISTKEAVVASLRARILDGVVAPGVRLPEAELAAEFGPLPPAFLPVGVQRLYELQMKALEGAGPVHLVGFSWGGVTSLRVAVTAPELVESLAVIEPEAYGLLRTEDADAFAVICGLRDSWRANVRAGRWHEAFEEFVDFYNGPGSFAGWPEPRREEFLATQRERGDLWDLLFDDMLTVDSLGAITAPVHVVEGSKTSTVDHAICKVVRRQVPDSRHTLIEGAGHMMPLSHPEPLARALLSGIET